MARETTESLLDQGYQARREHRPEDAQCLFETAVLKCRRRERHPLLARSLIGLGQIERDLGNLDTALDCYGQAVQILRTLNDPPALAHTIRHVGDIQRNRREFDQAAPCYVEALEIYRANEFTPPLDLANTLRGYALLKGELGSGEEAKLLWAEAGQLYQAVGVQAGVDECARQIALLGTDR
jgi:tetratricopeptide (TPR) repeat protein